MADSKQNQSKREKRTLEAQAGDDVLPSYESAAPGPSASRPRAAASEHGQQPEARGPTLNDPFSFPSNSGLPSYAEASRSGKPIAIPQARPEPTAPFIAAFAPSLTSRGVTSGTWHSFVQTMSAFLTAKISDKAVAHAGDIARHLGSPPRSFGKGIARNAKSVSQHIKDNAKRGNIVGVAVGVVGGAFSLTVGTALSAVGTVVSMPGTAIGAVARKPQTPVERAAAYAAVANKDWLNARGLYAQILDTQQLCRLVGLSDPRQLIETASSSEGKDESVTGQLNRLEQYICEIEGDNTGQLVLGVNTLWLVVSQVPR